MSDHFTVQNYDTKGIQIGNNEFETDVLKFAGADTFTPGTILARDPADDKLVICNPVAVDGTEIPKAILMTEETRAGAGDNPVRVLVKGNVRLSKIFFDDSTTITPTHIDQLRDYGIIAKDDHEQNFQDNQ